ncbi:MAG TPA: acetyl-CoA carboxylase biotin carboxyl carrier protein [Bacteroidetes bacterium]|nr:acetyl-CoA carboxylase biotin carboxyl carrier protein [Bacteroidota bacterium]
MDLKSIQELLKFINKSNLTDVEIEQQDFKLRVQRRLPENVIYNTVASAPQIAAQAAAPLPAPVAEETLADKEKKSAESAEDDKKLYEYKAPFIGTFYRASSPDKPPFINVGDTINGGKVLGIIEAMKLFNEIESDVNGKIVKILVENAQPVEYEQPLFLIELL